jgi:hypothetical protein
MRLHQCDLCLGRWRARGIAPKYENKFYSEIIGMQFHIAHISGQNCSSSILSTATKESGHHLSVQSDECNAPDFPDRDLGANMISLSNFFYLG